MSPKWRKVLYEDQGVPDNYVDDSFLAQMRKNIYVREYKYWNVVVESGSIQQQLCWNILFAVCFYHLYLENISPWQVVYLVLPLSLAGYCLDRRMTAAEVKTPIIDDLRTTLLFVGILIGLSPVLRTLTETISTDTIFTMSVMFFLADMIFYNYGVKTAMVSETLSLNAALFAAICLTSRLSTNLHTFVTVSLAMIVFGLRPPLAMKLKLVMYPFVQVFITTVLCSASFGALLTISNLLAFGFIILAIALMFLCPLILVSMQKLKNNIYGPWDEAMVKD